jgi:protein TonB
MPATVVDATPSDIAPGIVFAGSDAAPRFEPVALVEAAGDDVLPPEDHAVGAVHDGAEGGVPDAPDDAVVAFDEPLAAPAPWWQSPRLADRGTLATASLDQDPVAESTRPGGFELRPSPHEAASPSRVVVDESQPKGDVSRPAPRQSEGTPTELHESSYEPPRGPAPGRRPSRQPASTSRFSRHAGLALVAAAVLIVAVVVGAPSIVFWPPYVPPDPAIAPPVSEAELAAAVAALQSQPLTDPASSTVSTAGAKPPTSSAAAASAAVTQAPSSKRPDRNAAAKRRTAARPTARPEPPRVQNESSAVSPIPLAASSIDVPAQAVHAPAAAQPVPSGPAYEATQVDTRPKVESQVAARVPDQLRDRRFEEALVVRVLVSSVGRASDVRVLRGSRIDASLDAAALTAVKQWRFSPARRRGQAVDCWFSVGVPFRSEGGGTDR